MLAQRPLKLLLIMVLIGGGIPVIGWAGGPTVLADEDLDDIYAQGIWVNFEINIALPGGHTLSVPSITLPDITMPNNVAVVPANGGSVDEAIPTSGTAAIPVTGQTSPSGVSDDGNSSVAGIGATGTSAAGTSAVTTETVSSAYQLSYPGAGIFVTDNAMQGNSGFIINAPNSAISMSISVVVLNNSTVNGNILQSTNSYPTNLFLSMRSYVY
jgi:hypothetical protein